MKVKPGSKRCDFRTMLYCTGRACSPSESLACVFASISCDPGSHDLNVLSRKAQKSRKYVRPITQSLQAESGSGQQDGSSVFAQGQKNIEISKTSGYPNQNPATGTASHSNHSKSPTSIVGDARSSLISSPLVEEPTRALVRALGRTLLGLHPVGQAGESRHAGSLTGCAGVGSATAAKRLSDATEWVVGEVGLGRSGAEATSGTLLSSLKAFLDGKKLRLESGMKSVNVQACDDGDYSG